MRSLPLTRSKAAHVTRFAVIGDFGEHGHNAHNVSQLVKSWQPDFITTVGDNHYGGKKSRGIDANIGEYYHSYIYPYLGDRGPGAFVNRFFPILGNHDWYAASCVDGQCRGPYFDYFTLPGNQRYYSFDWGPVRFFMLNSDPHEPDGISGISTQAMWLRAQLATSKATWNLVYLHHPPYSSGQRHGSHEALQWPFAQWGAHVVLSGHDHTYERIHRDSIVYFVNGVGGRSHHPFGSPVDGSQLRYSNDFGAMLVDATDHSLTFEFYDTRGKLIDRYTMTAPSPRLLPAPLNPEQEERCIVRIHTPMDDASEMLDDGTTLCGNTELALGSRSRERRHLVGLRFPGVDIPACATVIDARIEFTACHKNKGDTFLRIHGERAGSAQVFSHGQFNLSQRTRTKASVQWSDLPRWKKVGESHQTPDLASIVQEIVDQPGWNVGNPVVFLIEGEGKRNAVTYNLQPAAAPRLVVQYQRPQPEPRPASESSNRVPAELNQKIYLPVTIAQHHPSLQCMKK
ncbi:metallophosphoesterase [Chloroflexi bacterium TSY]|nr:metallophosphoesterase [Chloroflexi bacterium TSY]